MTVRPVITLVDGEPVVSWVDNDDLAEYTDLVTSEHNQRPKYMAMVGAVVDSPKSLRDWYDAVPLYFDLDTAVGAQLDIIGEWVGRSRDIAQPITGAYFTWDDSGEQFIDTDYALAPAALTRSLGTGNGTTTHFVMPVTPTASFRVFRSDWQGNQRMHATARTNYALNNQNPTLWQTADATVVADAMIGPDGVTTTFKQIEAATTAQHLSRSLFSVAAGDVRVFFADLKAGERKSVRLAAPSSLVGTPLAFFDLDIGIARNPSGAILGYGIIPLPNGWYRCWISCIANSVATGINFNIVPCSNPGGSVVNYLGDGTSGFYVAQCQIAEILGSLIVTGAVSVTQTDYTFTAPNAIDFAVAPVSGAALTAVYANSVRSFPLPSQSAPLVPIIKVTDWQGKQLQYTTPRTNYLLNSNDITLWLFTGARGTTPSVVVGPNGTTLAAKLIEDTTTGVHQLRAAISVTAGQNNVFWVDLKAAERTIVRVAGSSAATGTPSIFCNLTTGVLSNQGGAGLLDSGSINLGNGWWRVWLACAINATIPAANFYVGLVSTGTTTSYTGDNLSGVYVAHGQFEDGVVPTSNIITGAASVTVIDYVFSPPVGVTFTAPPLAGSIINVSGTVYSFSRLGWDSGYWKGEFDPAAGIISLPDDAYRTLLRAKIAANHWDGTIEGAYDVWQQAFSGTSIILIQDNQDMSMVVAISGSLLDPITEALLTGGYIPLRPEGVKINYYAVIPQAGRLFGWDVENDAIAGWESGQWANELLPTQ